MEKTATQLVKESKSAIDIGLAKEARHGVIEILNRVLCDENIIYIKTKNYHWNVVGQDISERHAFLGNNTKLLMNLLMR